MSMAEAIGPHIPYLRRYARALTGSQDRGDCFVAASLETILEAPDEFPKNLEPRLALYSLFQKIWSSTQSEAFSHDAAGGELEQVAQKRLTTLTPQSRQVLLLTTLEGFTTDEAATILNLEPQEADQLLAKAVEEIDRQTATGVLIIEDEPIIAMDLQGIVERMGHSVSAVTDTRSSAVEAAKTHRPGLVLADIQLADGSSGIDAVKDILDGFEVPVIFITAYPDRLLTGERPEPTFLITKPFQESTVKATISQALFFESTAQAV